MTETAEAPLLTGRTCVTDASPITTPVPSRLPLRPPARYLPIAEHGVIGDLHSAALVGSDGTIDWYSPDRSIRSRSARAANCSATSLRRSLTLRW
jgi:hypothetical protein